MSTYEFLGKYPYLTPLSITSNEATLTFDSLNLRRKVVKKNAQRFEFVITVSGGQRDTLHADLMANWLTYGASIPFTIEVPQHLYTDNKTEIATVITNVGQYNAGSSSITITSNSSYKIPAGRFIRFSNHNKIYVTKNSVEVNSGVSILEISPSLTTLLASTTTVLATDILATVLNEPENSVFTYESGVIQSATLKFIEKI